MTKSNKVPVLRFSEFKDSWEEKKLENYLEFKNGINASKEQYGKGKKFINVLDIINNQFITFDNILGSVDVSEDVFKKNEVSYGDILFQRSSETRDEVGQANVYLDKEKSATFGGFVIRGKKIREYEPIFMNFLLKTDLVRNDITSKSGGSTRYNVGQETLKIVVLNIPSLFEQTKIANFLISVDKKIEQLTKKKELLNKYKKGVMQKIFSQEIRFKDDNGNYYLDWEEKKIGEIFNITRGNVLSMLRIKSIKDQIYIYPVYSSQTLNGGLAGFYNEYLFENSITWTTDGANAGSVNFRRGKFYCTNVCGVLQNKEGYSNSCIAEILNSVTKKYVSYVGNPKLMNNVMSNIIINIPLSVFEQHKIAIFLSAIDKKIDLVNFQLEKTKTWKKGLLQKMFI